MKNNRLLLSLIVVLCAIVLISGSAYAFWVWESVNQNTNVSFMVQGKDFSCSADGGGNITSNDITLEPTTCTDTKHVIVREIHTSVVNNTSQDIKLDLWLYIHDIASELSSSTNFKWALTTSDLGCTSGTVINSGTFANYINGNKVSLISNKDYSSLGTDTYYLYIWLDEAETNANTAGKSFNMSLGGECSDLVNIINKPYISNSGLIPVKLSDSGDTVTTVAESDNTWYDYENKKWANAVLVTEDTHTRSYYKNNPNTVVPQEDILAYYVWIPRYSYQVWAYSGSDPAGDPREIPIEFVSANTKDVATQIGEWHTHPAFTFGDQELTGIWVGKFEIHHTNYTTTSSANFSCTVTSCDNTKYNGIRILPNVRPLTDNNASSYYYLSRTMENNDNIFGLNANSIDSHMMKNREWGAVAYLSHSRYGINDKIKYNGALNVNYNGATRSYLTGCGTDYLGYNNNSKPCDIQYGTVSSGIYPQSTTGNVTGAFDMSGGTYDMVMGIYIYSYPSGGFNQTTNPYPNEKYYDAYPMPPFYPSQYDADANLTSCTFEYCGGHSLYETRNWYNVNSGFVFSSYKFFHRGGNYMGSGSIFYANFGGTTSSAFTSSRFVLVEE